MTAAASLLPRPLPRQGGAGELGPPAASAAAGAEAGWLQQEAGPDKDEYDDLPDPIIIGGQVYECYIYRCRRNMLCTRKVDHQGRCRTHAGRKSFVKKEVERAERDEQAGKRRNTKTDADLLGLGADKVRKTASRPRSWANSSHL